MELGEITLEPIKDITGKYMRHMTIHTSYANNSGAKLETVTLELGKVFSSQGGDPYAWLFYDLETYGKVQQRNLHEPTVLGGYNGEI